MAVTYRQAGVDIDEANSLIERIKPLARATRTPFVLEDVGGFAGLCGIPSGLEEPVLVSGTDGVGTKLKVAFATGRHDTIGQDLVAMCVNDVITTGAEPLFFLDYFGTGKLSADTAASVIKGIADGCKLAGCALLGGETAELPGMYADGEYDLAGFSVGIADRKKLLGPARVKAGDVLIGVASTGLHSNGYSLARRVIEQEMKLALDAQVPALGKTVGDALLTPTKIYAKTVRELKAALGADLHALCHITGGGVPENLPRVLPDDVLARIDGAREWPALFQLIAEGGPVEISEMRRTFNLGIGLIAVVDAGRVDAALAALDASGEDAWRLGSLVARPGKPEVEYVGDPAEARFGAKP
jgi:phosphoribosylformylglycinamidine cyclo-ligase